MLTLALFAVFAQSIPAQSPAFDAASIKVVKLASHPAFGNHGGPGTSDPGRIHLCCVGMYSLLMRAYGVELDRLSGPAWIMDNLGPNLYQLDATMPPATTAAQFELMMQNLLAERFHLRMHREKRNFPGYELSVATGGPKFHESKEDASAAAPDSASLPARAADGTLTLPPGPQLFTSLGQGMVIVQVQDKPIADFVKAMGRMIAQSQGENPNDFASPKPRVVDKTGLTGHYDFTLRFSCDACQFATPAESPGAQPDIFAALKNQLGLKLVKTKGVSLDVIVVDRVDKTPTPN